MPRSLRTPLVAPSQATACLGVCALRRDDVVLLDSQLVDTCVVLDTHRFLALRSPRQDRVEPHLRATLSSLRALRRSGHLSERRIGLADQLVPIEAGAEHDVQCVVIREAAVVNLVDDAPSPAELHGADRHATGSRVVDDAVAGLHDEYVLTAHP
jgi:hypothetical protein